MIIKKKVNELNGWILVFTERERKTGQLLFWFGIR
jgi:hypothetical protein